MTVEMSQLTPRRPYLLRAFYEWLLDNQLTPHLVVDVTLPGVLVPMEYARDGQIVLNIAPRAVGNLELGNDEVRFNARFGGVPRQVSAKEAVLTRLMSQALTGKTQDAALFVSLIKTTLPDQFAEEADDALSTDEAKLLEAIASKMLMARGERGEDV